MFKNYNRILIPSPYYEGVTYEWFIGNRSIDVISNDYWVTTIMIDSNSYQPERDSPSITDCIKTIAIYENELIEAGVSEVY